MNRNATKQTIVPIELMIAFQLKLIRSWFFIVSIPRELFLADAVVVVVIVKVFQFIRGKIMFYKVLLSSTINYMF